MIPPREVCDYQAVALPINLVTQILKNWHLMCIVIGICGAGMLLILARSIAQGITDPQLVTNTEDPQGTTACHYSYTYSVD